MEAVHWMLIWLALYSLFVGLPLYLGSIVRLGEIPTLLVFAAGVSVAQLVAVDLRRYERGGRSLNPFVQYGVFVPLAVAVVCMIAFGSMYIVVDRLGLALSVGLAGLAGIGGMIAIPAAMLRVVKNEVHLAPDPGPVPQYLRWWRDVGDAWERGSYRTVLQLLGEADPRDTGAFLFWLSQESATEDRALATQILEYMEESPMARMPLGKVRFYYQFSAQRARAREAPGEGLVEPTDLQSPILQAIATTCTERLTSPSFSRVGRRLQLRIKRAFDVVLAVAILLAATVPVPLFLVIFLLQAWRWKRWEVVFFVTTRVGQFGSTFEYYQFRALPEDGDQLHSSRLGTFLLWTGLDRLPALISVIRGTMSLVGPHALYDSHLEQLERMKGVSIEDLALRQLMSPGLIGGAQLAGLRDPWAHRCRDYLTFDVEYVRNWSLLGDVRILLQCVLLYVTFLAPNALVTILAPHNLPPIASPAVRVPPFLRQGRQRRSQ